MKFCLGLSANDDIEHGSKCTVINRKNEITRWKNHGSRSQKINFWNHSKFYILDSQYCKKCSTWNLVCKHFNQSHREERGHIVYLFKSWDGGKTAEVSKENRLYITITFPRLINTGVPCTSGNFLTHKFCELK